MLWHDQVPVSQKPHWVGHGCLETLLRFSTLSKRSHFSGLARRAVGVGAIVRGGVYAWCRF